MNDKRWQFLADECQKAFQRLEELQRYSTEQFDFVLDASIQRFEFSFELCWKLMKRILWEEEKIEALSPRQVLQQAYALGWIHDETLWLQMLLDRNMMSHAYRELDANEVYQRIPSYLEAFLTLHCLLKDRYAVCVFYLGL